MKYYEKLNRIGSHSALNLFKLNSNGNKSDHKNYLKTPRPVNVIREKRAVLIKKQAELDQYKKDYIERLKMEHGVRSPYIKEYEEPVTPNEAEIVSIILFTFFAYLTDIENRES